MAEELEKPAGHDAIITSSTPYCSDKFKIEDIHENKETGSSFLKEEAVNYIWLDFYNISIKHNSGFFIFIKSFLIVFILVF